MADYPLQALLNVRQYREQSAQNAARAAENAYRECSEKCLKQKKAIEEYRQWRFEEEERKYSEILEKKMTAEELENFRNSLSLLKAKENAMEEELANLEAEKQKAKELSEQKKEEFKTAQKNTAKIEAHRQIWKQEEKKEQERQEDLEAEEFKPLAPIGSENKE